MVHEIEGHGSEMMWYRKMRGGLEECEVWLSEKEKENLKE
jgi:hypothetical protein